ncbi:Oidioi.mRNA.OKI2018_I69.XSR.g13470.t1.cds [Oikopleura dioica]|uniref:Oidioi.mRNA.OKI2018_I69.XSR.g13470.t1.cds n=1 Tax=Oikopleura dioica TaxID=34765 RepID=A0ABN7S6Z7_OIKDI|nr:Oidioi.mRNA.OKI2018_I69.XSR.g13470.t1.cds [Oikopleura dioica]
MQYMATKAYRNSQTKKSEEVAGENESKEKQHFYRRAKADCLNKLEYVREDMAEKASNKAFIGVAVTALILCVSAITFHCFYGPHPVCDTVFYRVLPLFDCVYIMGAIIGLIAAKLNYPLLYVFFIVSACCTCSCYSLNSVIDLMVLTNSIESFGKNEPTTDDITGEMVDCSDPDLKYHYQRVDLALEMFGIIIHVMAIIIALKSRKRLIQGEMRKARTMTQLNNCRKV